MKRALEFVAVLLMAWLLLPMLAVGWICYMILTFIESTIKSMQRSWRNVFPPMTNTTEPAYTVEVYVLQMDKRINDAVVQEWHRWIPVGNPKPRLDVARATLQAVRRMPLYAQCKMRIVSGGYTLIEVEPGDDALVEFHNGVK